MYLLIRSNWNKRVEKVKRATVEDYEDYQDGPVEVLMVEKASSDKMSSNTQSLSDDEEYEDRLPTPIGEKFEHTPTGELT